MDVILINDKKLKVILTRADMDAYDLCCDNMDYDNTETRRAIWSIFDEAKQRTGFDAASERIFIQAYPSSSGGCELYVTKLAGGGERNCTLRREKTHNSKKARTLYRFDSLDRLASACRRLSDGGYSGESAAYSGGGRYYLLLDAWDEAADYICDRGIGEYGAKCRAECILALDEHCTVICSENACGIIGGIA